MDITDAVQLDDDELINAADNTSVSVISLAELLEERLEDEYEPGPKVAGFMETQEDVELPARSVWYVRAMVARGIQALEESIQECTEAAAKDDLPAWAKRSLEGAVSYNQQLLNEARQFIPTSFQ